MSNNEILTDDYVAGLLTQEANDCSLKYSALGMEGFRTEKKPSNMLKPNTRFLRHIIKGTDTHNKALLAKEAAESQARLKDLDRVEEDKKRKRSQATQDMRRRQMGDIKAILGGNKRRRDNDEGGPSSSRELKIRGLSRKSDKASSQHKAEDLTSDRHHERVHRRRLSPHGDRHIESDGKRERDSLGGERKRRRSRSRDSRSEDDDRRHRHRRRSYKSRSTEHRGRSQSPRRHKSRHRDRSPMEERRGKSRQSLGDQDHDSDLLEDLIGPAPPPKYRGRGKIGGSSGIDRRFSDTYDPKVDVEMDEDDAGHDSEDAIEAFRDRQKLKQIQQQRMREAGFTDDQINRGDTTDEKLKQSVQWSKVGEERAWDHGKSLD